MELIDDEKLKEEIDSIIDRIDSILSKVETKNIEETEKFSNNENSIVLNKNRNE